MIIGTDFFEEMVKTARKNAINYPNKKVKFVQMDNLNMKFPNNMFDLVSARHTIINAKQIYNSLNKNGVLVIEGVDEKDCWELKEIFNRGQGYNSKIRIAQKDYDDIKEANFSKIETVQILQKEYY